MTHAEYEDFGGTFKEEDSIPSAAKQAPKPADIKPDPNAVNEYDITPTIMRDDGAEVEGEDFLIGVLKTSPVYFVTMGGVCFPSHTAYPLKEKRDPDALETERAYRTGEIIRMTSERAAKVRAAIKSHVVRWSGSGDAKTGKVYSTSRGTVHGDEPLACHLYMVRVSDIKEPIWLARNGDIFPPSMYEMAREAAQTQTPETATA